MSHKNSHYLLSKSPIQITEFFFGTMQLVIWLIGLCVAKVEKFQENSYNMKLVYIEADLVTLYEVSLQLDGITTGIG